MAVAGTAQKIFGGISAVLGICVTLASAWLLMSSLNDPHCKNFDRNRSNFYRSPDEPFPFRDRDRERDRERDRDYIYSDREREPDRNRGRDVYINRDSRNWNWKTEGLGRGRGFGIEFVEGRNLEVDDYCLNYLDYWVIGAGIGLGIGILQLLISGGFFFTGFRGYCGGSSAWAIFWCICHIFFVLGLAAALTFGIIGEVYMYYIQIRNLGFAFCAATGSDAVICIVLVVLAHIFVVKKLREDSRAQARRRREHPNSRTEFLRNSGRDSPKGDY